MADLIADVAAGGFTEIRRHRLLRADEIELVLDDRHGEGSTSSRGAVDEFDGHESLPNGVARWPPWIPATDRRPEGAS